MTRDEEWKRVSELAGLDSDGNILPPSAGTTISKEPNRWWKTRSYEPGPPTPPVYKPGTCGTCKWWTPATREFVSTCHNLVAGLGAHIESGANSRCNYHEPKP